MQRIARLVVRLYPRAWRARYEDEILALIDETGLSFALALDLVRGGLVERTRTSASDVVTYLGQTWLERHTRPGFAGAGPLPLLALATIIAVPLHSVSALIVGELGRAWPALSTRGELLVMTPFWLCCISVLRLMKLRPRRIPRREDREFVARVDAYPLPPLNRFVALFWSYRPMSAEERWRNHHALMRASEGALWMALVLVARVSIGWIHAIEHGPVWQSYQCSLYGGFFIVAIATAVVRGRRFGISGADRP